MKNSKNAITLILLGITLVGKGQLPDFTLVDTGAIYEYGAGKQHTSGIILDVDNDGDMDPATTNNGVDRAPIPMVVYINERNGNYIPQTFLPETSKAFPVLLSSPSGDIDNDGDIDIIGQIHSSAKLGVFVNDGYGNFTSDTMFYLSNSFASFYPVLLDFNRDGFLDIIRFDNNIQVLYNNGEGKFNKKEIIGHYGINSTLQHSMSLADADNDGDMDVYCGHSFQMDRNFLFINTGDSLEQIVEDHIVLSDPTYTLCVNWIDYDNDGDMDLYVHNFTDIPSGPLPSLYENLGNLEFAKHTIYKEEYRSVFSNSSNWADLDNDGDLDLFLPLENNPFFLLGSPLYKKLSSHPYNILYLNDGTGEFTEVTDNALTQGICHTAEIFDHDNDGDLDVLTIGNAWASNGRNQLYVNEGNSNNSILINCTDKYGCSTPYGTRIYARTRIFGKHVLQTREITPVDGNLSFAHTRMHFGLGDADGVDSLIIRWPSGHMDTFLNVSANQFYHAIEDSILAIDYRATNYIEYSPSISDVDFSKTDTSVVIDLLNHFRLVTGDTLPEITGDTLIFQLQMGENDEVVSATLDGHMLTLTPDLFDGAGAIKIITSAGFTKRMDQISLSNMVNIPDKAFLDALIEEGVDTNGSGIIGFAEAESVYTLNISSRGISDLTGIEAFINLEDLNCSDNLLTHLDLSASGTLIILDCGGNALRSLEIPNLLSLACPDNQLSNLDVSNVSRLANLFCNNNLLTDLDVSQNLYLQTLYCGGNMMESIDISGNRRIGTHPFDVLVWEYTYWTDSLRYDLDLGDMPSLYRVCTWEGFSFLPVFDSIMGDANATDSVYVKMEDSPNIHYTTNCLADFIPPAIALDTTYLPDSIMVQSSEEGIVYLVPSGSEQDLKILRETHIDSVETINKIATFLLGGLGNGSWWLYARDSSGNLSEPGKFSILIDQIENSQAWDFRIYPNPFNAFLHIHNGTFNPYDIEIVSLSGHLLFRKMINEVNCQINLSSFRQGVYIITLRSKDNTTTRKIIKLK